MTRCWCLIGLPSVLPRSRRGLVFLFALAAVAGIRLLGEQDARPRAAVVSFGGTAVVVCPGRAGLFSRAGLVAAAACACLSGVRTWSRLAVLAACRLAGGRARADSFSRAQCLSTVHG